MHSLHVLITSLDASVREALEDFLTERGCQVTMAVSIRECLFQMQDVSPDLLVLAPPLMGESGAEPTQNVQSDLALEGVPILMLGRSTGDESAASAVAIVAEYLDHQWMRSLPISRMSRSSLSAALLKTSAKCLWN